MNYQNVLRNSMRTRPKIIMQSLLPEIKKIMTIITIPLISPLLLYAYNNVITKNNIKTKKILRTVSIC